MVSVLPVALQYAAQIRLTSMMSPLLPICDSARPGIFPRRVLNAAYSEKSSSFSRSVSSAAGRGGTRFKGSYLNARQWCSTATMPRLTQATSRSLICWPRWQ